MEPKRLADVLRNSILKQWVVEPELLLHPQIPKPMHGLAPRVVYGDAWWARERRKVYASTGFHCQACGVAKDKAKYHQWLEAHETFDVDYVRGRMTYLRTVPLCHYCHNYIHDGRLLWLLQERRINHKKYLAIIQHGDEVLAEAGRKRASFEEREAYIARLLRSQGMCNWGDWRMVIDGVEYLPLYSGIDEYNRLHNKESDQ